MVTTEIQPTMEQYYAKAVTYQAYMTQQGSQLANIVPLTTTGNRGMFQERGRRGYGQRYINNIEVEDWTKSEPEELSEMQQELNQKNVSINQIEKVNNTENTFSKGTRLFTGQARNYTTKGERQQMKFSGAAMPIKDITCWTCGQKGHMSTECKPITNRRPTTSMGRSNSRN